MTREEAINELKQIYDADDYSIPYETHEALDTAIRSLEMWDKVLNDIKEIDNMPNWQKHNSSYWHGLSDVIGIIDKHLQEVEE